MGKAVLFIGFIRKGLLPVKAIPGTKLHKSSFVLEYIFNSTFWKALLNTNSFKPDF